MKILHTSDIHGGYERVLEALASGDHDVWVDSGDFFPNKTRGDRDVEPAWQAKWSGWKNIGDRLVAALAGRPLVCVGGNHDYVDLAAIVRDAGGTAFNLADGPATVGGRVFAGFREVPYIAGEWNGETHDFDALIEGAMGCDPAVLVTHSPPGGILDDSTDGHPPGIGALTNRLMYAPHGVVVHLFGHIHVHGGSVEDVGGIVFSNAATAANTITLG